MTLPGTHTAAAVRHRGCAHMIARDVMGWPAGLRSCGTAGATAQRSSGYTPAVTPELLCLQVLALWPRPPHREHRCGLSFRDPLGAG